MVDVPVPDVKGRTEILRHYLGKMVLDEDVDKEKVIDRLARATIGMTGADLANLTNQAAIKVIFYLFLFLFIFIYLFIF